MEYDVINNIGLAIDNVYNNICENPTRKTIAKLSGDQLVLEYRTILTVAKDQEFEHQMNMIKSESKQMIDARMKSIKKCFKECSGKSLKVSLINDYDRIETLTVSPYSPIRTLKYSFVANYEIS
tara:strand:+ start:128 stop:499 length:372 start_codon:yes stop_codon:yes gene_type:complete